MNAIISGAGNGIGKGITMKLCKMGYDLLIISRNKENLEKLKNELAHFNPNSEVTVFTADLSTTKWQTKFKNTFQAYTPDIVVNNVGGYMEDVASKIETDRFKSLLQLNFISAVELTNFLLPKMKSKRKGYIINVCSVAAKVARLDAVSYSITKSALAIWGKALAKEIQMDGIKLTNIFPGSVATSSWDGSDADLSKMIQIDDIASAFEYLLNLSENTICDEIVLSPMGEYYSATI